MSGNPSLRDSNVRSQIYYVVRTKAGCRHCGLPTRLLALALPRNHQTLDAATRADAVDSRGVASDEWQRSGVNALLFYVEQLADGVRKRLEQFSRDYRLAYSPLTLNSYWANHCEHCATLLEDHDLHCEPDGAFLPTSEVDAANIHLLPIHEHFEAAAAGYAFEPEFFRFMRKGC